MKEPQVNLDKVRAALMKYAPNRLMFSERPTKKSNTPEDAGRRKHVKRMSESCKGFEHKDFIH